MALDDVTVGDPHASAHNDERHVINQLETNLDAHISDVSDAHDASAISFTPSGKIAASTVQGAIVELMQEEYNFARGITTNLNTLHGAENAGAWFASAASIGAPSAATHRVIVGAQTADSGTLQIAIDASGSIYSRFVTATTRTDWVRLDTAPFSRGTFTGNLDDLSAAGQSGTYRFSSSSTNTPKAGSIGTVLVLIPQDSYLEIHQIAKISSGETYARGKAGSAGASWTAWKRLDIDEGAVRFDSQQTLTEAQKGRALGNVARGVIAPTDNIDTFRGSQFSGSWVVTGGGDGNRPFGTSWVMLRVDVNSVDSTTIQTATRLSDGTTSVRVYSTTWTAWKRLDIDTGAVRFDNTQYLSNVQLGRLRTNMSRGWIQSGDLDAYFGTEYDGTWYVSGEVANRPGTLAGLLTVETNQVVQNLTVQRYAEAYATGGLYVRWRTTNNVWTSWQKLSVERDTGWRTIYTGDASDTGFSSGRLKIRRVNTQVTLQLEDLVVAAGTGPASTSHLFPVDGFIPPSPGGVISGLVGANADPRNLQMITLYNNMLYCMGPPYSADLGSTFPRVRSVLRGQLQWHTDRAWPTTLPGTPA